eukprot:3825588-Prymnesium_polylepis.2
MGQTAQQIFTGDEAHINTINVEPLRSTETKRNSLQKIEEAHDLSHYNMLDKDSDVIPMSRRGKVGVIGRNAIRASAAGILPIAIAGFLTEQIMPDEPEPAKLITVTGTAAGITKVASPALGAGAVSATSLLLPIGSSLVAAGATSKWLDVVLPDDMNHLTKSVIQGGAAGATGVTAFTGVAAGQTTAINAISNVTAASNLAAAGGGEVATATGVGVEMATTGAVAAEEVGIGAAALVGGEIGAEAGSFLAPETFGLSVVAGTALGATVGFFTGLFHH